MDRVNISFDPWPLLLDSLDLLPRSVYLLSMLVWQLIVMGDIMTKM